MNRTNIEYLDYSWNPIAMRCTPVSEGCANCWHLRMANRFAGNQNLPFDMRRAYAGEGLPVLVESRLADSMPKKSARIGVQFMGDLFHEDVPLEFIHKIWRTMVHNGRHIYQILTKRHKRMLTIVGEISDRYYAPNGIMYRPSLNIWLGVSVENQKTADERREYLRQTPAAIKFVSYEPALSPIDWIGWEFVDQIISGGETGPKARPSHPDWHRATRDFCQKHNIAYFYKQGGEYVPADGYDQWGTSFGGEFVDPARVRVVRVVPENIHSTIHMVRVGKKQAGRLLDGREWNEFPQTA